MRRRAQVGCALLAVLIAAASIAACASGGKPQLEVSAAASLKKAFSRYGQSFKAASTRFSFAGSDALAAQIEQGARPDVFASANTKLPDALHAKGLLEKPIVFIANRLVLAVPASSQIADLGGIERPGVSLAIGTPTVPIGAYTAKLLARLPAPARRLVLANVRDREPDVTGIVGKLTQGAVDAGLLYATDVAATKGQLRAITLPSSLGPRIAYGVAIVTGSSHRAQAQAFIAGLLGGAGRAELLRDGFLAPPGP